jgi:uncharacterized protein (DUF4213/DUF364 family)
MRKVKGEFNKIVEEGNLKGERVKIRAKSLTPNEAIGNPERDDFPLLKGKERLMQAEFRESLGQAFTDMYGDFEGSVSDVLDMELSNNYRRAIFVASLNAVMRYLGLAEGTIHCKDKGPEECGERLVEFISQNYGSPKIALVGLQPAIADHLAHKFELRIVDLDPENIGRRKFGLTILDGSKDTKKILRWCDLALVTGTTAVNETMEPILKLTSGKEVMFYGVTVAGIAELLGLNRFCPCSS